MKIINGKYVSPVWVGSKEVRIAGLIGEAKVIANSGVMRMHAQGRELDRIERELAQLGVDLLVGTGGDEGWLLVVTDHGDGCQLRWDGDCYCRLANRFQSPL